LPRGRPLPRPRESASCKTLLRTEANGPYKTAGDRDGKTECDA